MAKRFINDSFWTDPYVEKLDPSEKLLFLYFLTNPLCNCAGIYEVRNSRVAFETGFDKEMVEKIKSRFVADGKMLLVDDWIILTNFVKNQANNPSIILGVQRILDSLPPKVVNVITGSIQTGGSLVYLTILNLTLPNLTKPGKEAVQEEPVIEVSKTTLRGIEEIIKAMESIDPRNQRFYGNTTQREACEFLIKTYGLENVLDFIQALAENPAKVFNVPTTPKMLMDNWVRIVAGAGFEKYKQNKNQPNLII